MLKVENLSKDYEKFRLSDVNFELEKGYIMGFIGMNGAGKTTTLKCILNLVKPTSGKITMLGRDITDNEVEIKQEVGFMLGESDYYPKTKIKKISKVFKRFFNTWQEDVYQSYMKLFEIDENKMICELSTGMRVKLSIAFALSHNAKLLIFDEPTSGLDPIARNELTDIFKNIIADGEHSILFSTHITSDLDKCADFILFIKNGKIIANKSKDDLIDEHILIAGKKSDLNDSLKAKLIGYKQNAFGFTALMKKAEFNDDMRAFLQSEKPNLEDIMIYYNEAQL